MNKVFTDQVRIFNFKSIKELQFSCKRINLFIGYPNVGKSNIIEALSLLDESILDGLFKLKNHVRYSKYQDLFYMKNVNSNIVVQTSYLKTFITVGKYDSKVYKQHIIYNNPHVYDYGISNLNDSEFDKLIHGKNLEYDEITDPLLENYKKNRISYEDKSTIVTSFIYIPDIQRAKIPSYFKNYKFKQSLSYNDIGNLKHLMTPFGNNLFSMLLQSNVTIEYISNYLKKYDYELAYKPSNNMFSIQQKMGLIAYDSEFSLIADTLQRMIFYSVAIESNSNSTILFEEPEVNSFPPFIQDLAYRIVESKSNQFFITTHSPYLLNTIIENGGDEVAVNIVGFKDNSTFIRQLNDEEIRDLLDYGSDIFLNIERYI